MPRHDWPAYSAIAGFSTVAIGCLVALWLQHPVHQPAAKLPRAAASAVAHPPVPSAPDQAVRPTPPQQQQQQSQNTVPASPEENYYDELRTKVRWVPTRVGAGELPGPDLHSRMLLAKSAAQRAGLAEVGLSFKDVYGIINAETSWVPRNGASKDGTPNLGVAQFEPATARALGLRNPNDLVEAVHVAARHMKEAALWSTDRIAGMRMDPAERALKLREGVSIYYNLSSKGRALWNGKNTRTLPAETQKHIANARIGAQEASFLEAQLQAMGTVSPRT
jgi:hypothetical protein